MIIANSARGPLPVSRRWNVSTTRRRTIDKKDERWNVTFKIKLKYLRKGRSFFSVHFICSLSDVSFSASRGRAGLSEKGFTRDGAAICIQCAQPTGPFASWVGWNFKILEIFVSPTFPENVWWCARWKGFNFYWATHLHVVSGRNYMWLLFACLTRGRFFGGS